MASHLQGIKLPHKKSTANMSSVQMPPPKFVNILMQMHIGNPSQIIVNIGDKVHVGTLIGKSDGNISAPVHSSVSGTVVDISDFTQTNGVICKCAVIESDGKSEIDCSITRPKVNTRDDFLSALKDSGIVGLGGAGFPTSVKYSPEKNRIKELIINCAECEPYITSDTRTMIERLCDISCAIEYIKEYLGVEKIIIGIEKNKSEAIAQMESLTTSDDSVTLKILPDIYPQGAEKVLIYHTTGKTVPTGKLPIDVGCIVSNCTTLADIGRYFKTGMPLVQKCVTVDGDAVKNPMNVTLPIGTSLYDLFEFTGGFKAKVERVLYGGPMMGIAVPSLSFPVLKNTNSVLAFSSTLKVKEYPCIRCGRCINTCPFGINPPMITRALKIGDTNAIVNAGALACMECGCCSYVCPAGLPLVDNNKKAKAFLHKRDSAKGRNKDE